MSTIKGGSEFPKKNQPIPGKPFHAAKTEDTSSSFQINDGLVLSDSRVSDKTDQTQIKAQVAPQDCNPLAQGFREAEEKVGQPIDIIGFDTCLMAEVDGQFLTGPGVGKATASSRVSESASAAGVSEFAFTNGIHSRQLIGLSGQVLADANPFR